MIHPSLVHYRPYIKELFKKHGIKNAFLFGSALSDRFNNQSDLDIIVNFLDYSEPLKVGQSIWDLEDELEALINRKIDLLTERSLKNPFFIKEVNETKELIYEDDAV